MRVVLSVNYGVKHGLKTHLPSQQFAFRLFMAIFMVRPRSILVATLASADVVSLVN
jgi:hypothetical protein